MQSQSNELKNLGNQAFQEKDYQKAIQYYTLAIEADPSQSIFYSNRAKCYKLLKNIKEAFQDSLQSIELDDKNIKGHLICGQLLCEQGKYDENKKIEQAITRLTKARTLCAGQKKQEFEKELDLYIMRARKLLWMKENDSFMTSNQKTVENLKEIVTDDIKLQPNEKDILMQQIEKYVQLQNQNFEIPEFLKCQITKQLILDPYTTPQGYSYEKQALFDFIKLNGLIDPITKGTISSIQLIYPNVNLKQASKDFIENNPWAFQYKEGETFYQLEF